MMRRRRRRVPNKSLQVTFDPPPIFAVAKTGVASNAPDLRRYKTCDPHEEFGPRYGLKEESIFP